MYDPHTRESRGFGFVTMESGEEADAAITALNGTELMGKSISVEKASSVSSSICARVRMDNAYARSATTGATGPCPDPHPRPLLRPAEEERMCVATPTHHASLSGPDRTHPHR